ncbi:MAG: general secretion pathway protein GspK [Planctomycetes bacterium]|nr:general secretion pathway protein GspK [Planctomycetota bacterium]
MRSSGQTRRSGLVLIVTLLMIAVLAGVIFEIYYESRMALHVSGNRLVGTEARWCAEGGLALAMDLIEQMDSLWSDETLWPMISGQQEISIGPGICRLVVTQESGRLNVNHLKHQNGDVNKQQVDLLLRLIDAYNERAQEHSSSLVSYAVVAAIIDWIDVDDEVTVLASVRGDNQGAEQAYYRELKPSYTAKNAPCDVLSELGLVKGLTADNLYGVWDSETGKRSGGLASCLTVYGDNVIEINSASAMMIQSLSNAIDSQLAQAVVDYRPYTNIEQLQAVPGMTEPVSRILGSHLGANTFVEHYRVKVTAQVGQIGRSLGAVVKKSKTTGTVELIMQWAID